MATTYCEMLENIFKKTSLTKGVLTSICKGSTMSYKRLELNKLEKAGYVRAVEVVRNQNGSTKKSKHYFITPSGVRFLRECAIKDAEIKYESKKKTSLPWLRYIDEESTKKMALLGDVSKDRDKIFAVGEAAMMSELAGATIPFFVQDSDTPIDELSEQRISAENTYGVQKEIEYYESSKTERQFREWKENDKNRKDETNEGENQKTAFEVMKQAVIEWQKDAHNIDVPDYDSIRKSMNYTDGEVYFKYPSENEDYIRYVHPSTVKYVALMTYNSSELMNKNDTARGRYSGMLQSKKRSLLLYPVHKPKFNWPSYLSAAESSADRKWKERLKPEFKENSVNEGTCGAILIQSPTRFRSIWTDPMKHLRTKTELGFLFSHLYVIEIENNGTKNLRDIMLNKTSEYTAREIAEATQEDFGASLGVRFERNTEFYSNFFPLKAKFGDTWFYFAIGKWIDIRQVERLISLTRKDTSFGFGIICEKWQHEYYKIMIPDAVTYWRGKTVEEITSDTYESKAEEEPDGKDQADSCDNDD